MLEEELERQTCEPVKERRRKNFKDNNIAASITPPDASPFTINSISFSENGYHLLAPDSPSSVAIWDLSKMKTAHTISLGEGFKVNKVLYDYSAQYLGVVGSEGIHVFAHKLWDELVRFEEAGDVSDIVFGEQGKEICKDKHTNLSKNAGGRT
ncbi:hypothetical protein F4604DRAFT_2045473 [Suillus subluteus]|nr:hypothetical protein F4604DRAFT_2045473 [Suillus subluteus]